MPAALLARTDERHVSAGVAAGQQGEDLTRLWGDADIALYGAKGSGRNRVVAAAGAGEGAGGTPLLLHLPVPRVSPNLATVRVTAGG